MLSMGSLTVNAKSVIDGKDVAYFSASFQSDGNYNINKNVVDKATWDANATECKADFTEFESKAIEDAGAVQGAVE